MSKILRIRLRIPGEYRDVWLYKNRLHVWDERGVLRFADLDIVADHIAANYGAATSVIAQHLIFRNDWKVGAQFRSMMKVPEIETAFLAPFEGREEISLVIPSELFKVSESEPYRGPVLDTCIYADRVYFGTPEGLLESYISAKEPGRPYPLGQQTDFWVSKVSVRYAAINASAEERGLYFAPVEFWRKGELPGFVKASWQKVADYSLATSHASHNLLNYTEDSVPALLRAKTTDDFPREHARYEERHVVGYDAPVDLSRVARSALAFGTRATADGTRNHSSSSDEPHVLGNSSYHLLAAWDDRLQVIDIRAFDGGEIEARPSRKYANSAITPITVADVLETYPIAGGFIIELRNSLSLITSEGTFPLTSGEMGRVRTFASSIRYKEVVATIEEDDASLMGFYIGQEVLF